MRLLIGAFDAWGHRSILALGPDWIRYAVTLASA